MMNCRIIEDEVEFIMYYSSFIINELCRKRISEGQTAVIAYPFAFSGGKSKAIFYEFKRIVPKSFEFGGVFRLNSKDYFPTKAKLNQFLKLKLKLEIPISLVKCCPHFEIDLRVLINP